MAQLPLVFGTVKTPKPLFDFVRATRAVEAFIEQNLEIGRAGMKDHSASALAAISWRPR
jgi:hypothetical protein